MKLTRRAFLAMSSAMALISPAMAGGSGWPFGRQEVIALARSLASSDYEARPKVPQGWLDLTYEQYRSIWFRPTAALWAESNTPYEVDFFLPGSYFPRAVGIESVVDGIAVPVPFDLGRFDKTDKFPDIEAEGALGYSGFRLRTELTEAGKKNEFCVFQGASYFRAIGFNQIYGLSGRGLAIKTCAKHEHEGRASGGPCTGRGSQGTRRLCIHIWQP